MLFSRTLLWVILFTGISFSPLSLHAQTNETTHMTNKASAQKASAQTPVPIDARDLFREGVWAFSYGMGYGGFTPLFYGLGYRKDSFGTSDIYLHGLAITVGADYFFSDFFDIGFDLTMGGNLNTRVETGGERLNGGYTRMFLLLAGLRGLIHYPFSRADLYGGLSLGFGFTRQTFIYDNTSETDLEFLWALNWILRIGSRFPITDKWGVYAEASFPFPWITLGGYYRME